MTQRFACRNAGIEDCDFAVEGSTEDEMIEMAQRHARDVHDKDLSRQDVLNSAESAGKRQKARAGSSGSSGSRRGRSSKEEKSSKSSKREQKAQR